MLHVPRHQAPLLRHGYQPYCARAGRRPQRLGLGEGVDEAAGDLIRRVYLRHEASAYSWAVNQATMVYSSCHHGLHCEALSTSPGV
ncbi:hypothetical protein ACFX13_040496 [Malus domestica]